MSIFLILLFSSFSILEAIDFLRLIKKKDFVHINKKKKQKSKSNKYPLSKPKYNEEKKLLKLDSDYDDELLDEILKLTNEQNPFPTTLAEGMYKYPKNPFLGKYPDAHKASSKSPLRKGFEKEVYGIANFPYQVPSKIDEDTDMEVDENEPSLEPPSEQLGPHFEDLPSKYNDDPNENPARAAYKIWDNYGMDFKSPFDVLRYVDDDDDSDRGNQEDTPEDDPYAAD